MKQEEAARVLENHAKNGAGVLVTYGLSDALRMAAAALRGPQPDPDTGLMPCGCGGKARFVLPGDGGKWAECKDCLVRTVTQETLYEAKTDWNRAMGGQP